MASGGEPLEGLKYKVSVLKVSVHCEGCKKKIEKILKKIEGVYKVDIDASKKKVTVLASVDADFLIKKLDKAGKHAELWPEKKPAIPNPNKNDGNSKNESKEPSKSKEPREKALEKKPPPADGDSSTAAAAAKPASSGKKNEAAAEPSKTHSEAEKSNKEAAKSDDKKVEASTPPPEKPAAAVNAGGGGSEEKASPDLEASGNANGGKKKGKKTQKEGNEEVVAKNSDHAAAMDVPVPPMYPYQLYHHQQPSSAYVMSYNMSQPSVSHAYYAPPMPASSPEYTYAPYQPYYQPYPPPPPAEYYYGTPDGSSSSSSSSAAHPQSYDNYFSEENPNGCSLM